MWPISLNETESVIKSSQYCKSVTCVDHQTLRWLGMCVQLHACTTGLKHLLLIHLHKGEDGMKEELEEAHKAQAQP